MQLFADRGFFTTTVEDITEAADVGKGTFFNYFPSKEHVLSVLAEIQLGKVAAALEEAEAGKSSVHAVLHRFLLRVKEEPGRSQPLARSLISGLLSSPPVRELAAKHMAEGRKMLTKVFALAQQRSEISADRKPAQLALSLQQMLFGTLTFWAMQPEECKLHSWIEANFDHFWSALVPAKGSPR
jgi:AcrR family transcriptional regulator